MKKFNDTVKPCTKFYDTFFIYIYMIYIYISYGEGNGNPLQYSCLKNPMDGGAWWATVHGSQRVRQDWATSLSLSIYIYIYISYITLYIYHILYIYITFIYRYHVYIHKFFFNGICSKKNLKEFQNSCLWEHKTIAIIQWLYLYVKLCCMHIATKKVFKEPF